MQKPLLFLLIFLSLGASKCSSIEYTADIGFLNSAQANSMEYMVKVEDKICKDLDGLIGACTKRVRSDQSVSLKQDSRPYAYRLRVQCTPGTGIDFSIDVEAETAWKYTIKPESFSEFRSFSCLGEIFPHDRENRISALWQIRFIVVDSDYVKREEVYYKDDYIVFGKHAKHVQVCEDGDCEFFSEAPVVKADKKSIAWSESEMMRINYYGRR